MTIKTKYLLLPFFAFSVLSAIAQQSETEKLTEEVNINLSQGSGATLNFSFDGYSMNKRIEKGLIILRLDLGEEYISDPNAPFTGEVTVNFEARKNGNIVNVLSENTATLQVDNNHPVAHYTIDLSSLIATTGSDQNFQLDKLQMTISGLTLPTGYYGSVMRLKASSEIEMGLKVTGLASTVASVEVNNTILVSDKMVNFKWRDNHPITHYEIQLLRLYNTDPATAQSEQVITTKLDWNKAMSFVGKASVDQVDNTKFFSLTIGEGTGYYVFRMRPIGAYYNGGIADQRNWGNWSTHNAQGTAKSLTTSSVALPYFYFTDPDEGRNWIYSRIFSENNKIKEQLGFANGLMQSRQAQTYLPSQDITLITQTILDHSGRPAITTIPVPLAGRKNSYQEGLVKASGTNELYQAKHFDGDDNYSNPTATAPFAYYDNNPDKRIPNANGYGFARTIFYNESASRVREQSGVGEMHKIGSKTTKYLHATPSEDELIALFGDEAPSSESVIKTITIDPNDVASITYTSKEGHVIATSLAFYQQNTNLDELDETISNTVVQDKITKNSKTNEGFISSKRISLIENSSDLNISYSIECIEFEQLCQVAKLDCNFQLEINLIKLAENGDMLDRQQLISQDLSAVSCQSVNDVKYKIINLAPVSLPAGNYIIEKRLVTGNIALRIADNTANINQQVYPIVNVVAGWLDNIKDTQMLEKFNKSLYDLSQAINNQTLDQFTNSAFSSDFPVSIPASFFEVDGIYDTFKAEYSLNLSPADYNPYTTHAGRNPIAFTLFTPCCDGIQIPVQWIPPFDCEPKARVDANNDGFYNTVNYLELFDPESTAEQEYLPDFEGYALAFMSECIGPDLDFSTEQGLKNVIYGIYMDGWEIEGTFNMMVHHMLTDAYNTKNTAEEEPLDAIQYDCDRLLACWEAQLGRLKEEICTKFNFYQDAGKERVSDSYDDEYGNDTSEDKYEKDHDSHFDDSFKGGFFLTKWLAKRKVSKRMRGLQTGGDEEGEIAPEYGQFHLVKEFLECTGYQFAKIITPFDAAPLATDIDPVYQANHGYAITNTTEPPAPYEINHVVTKSDYFGGITTSLRVTVPSGYTYKYIPLSDWDPKKKTRSQAAKDDPDMAPTHPAYFQRSVESIFPNIKNPVYAFKYFEYPHVANPDYQILEIDVCYTDPNDCYQLDANGFIITDGSGNAIKVPCCSASPAWDANGCYADPDYPGLNANMVGYGTDNQNNPAKYVVNDFCEKGRVICPYTKNVWSAGQRLTFYSMLKTYLLPENADWEETTPYDMTCADLDTDHQWYAYTGSLSEQEAEGYPDLVNDLQINNYPSGNYSQLTLQDGTTTTFKFILREIEAKLKTCNSGCESKRNEFKGRLMGMLQEKCYEIGGCFVDEATTPHIIPLEDIDAIIDGMVAACKSQCSLSTYSCETTSCRDVARPFTQVGVDKSEFKINYGMGGYNPAFCDATSYNYNDAAYCTDTDGDGIYMCDLRDPVTGNINLLSWYEYTKLNQVASWDFDVDMPAMCVDEQGNPIATENDLTCCGATANTSSGDTFVPKNQYELNTTTAPDSNNPNLGDQVTSPTIGINVKINP